MGHVFAATPVRVPSIEAPNYGEDEITAEEAQMVSAERSCKVKQSVLTDIYFNDKSRDMTKPTK